jgi:rhamnogalacturonan endolyase
VIKQPGGGLDPGTARPSPDTYKLEAYNGKTREFMWRYDLGWNMNMGVWWTPYIAADFDGDGKAEVALKTAPRVTNRPPFHSRALGALGVSVAVRNARWYNARCKRLQ